MISSIMFNVSSQIFLTNFESIHSQKQSCMMLATLMNFKINVSSSYRFITAIDSCGIGSCVSIPKFSGS